MSLMNRTWSGSASVNIRDSRHMNIQQCAQVVDPVVLKRWQMMEIEEAIKHERWEAKYAGLEDADDTAIELNRQYHTEIADMLEELKELRSR